MIKQQPIDDYIEFITKTFKKASYPNLGNIYVFSYLFDHNLKSDKVKFYDFCPATFIYKIDMKEKTFTGFNLHSIPSSVRETWLGLIKENAGGKTLDPKKFLRLMSVLTKATFAVRNYSMKNVRNLKLVPKNQWDLLISNYANTTFGATTNEIQAKYLSLL